jgi:hypothetical protein
VADVGHPRGFETRRIDRTGDAPLLLHASRGTVAGRRIRRDHGRHAGGRAGVASRVLATGHAGPAPGEGLQAGQGKATTKCASLREQSASQSGTYLRQGLTGGSNVRFGRGDRRFRHITRARDHRDVPRDAAESLRRSPPFPRPPACRIAGEGACISKSRSRRETGEQHRDGKPPGIAAARPRASCALLPSRFQTRLHFHAETRFAGMTRTCASRSKWELAASCTSPIRGRS